MGDRKSRLAALAVKAGRNKPVAAEADHNDDPEETHKKSINFRNYAPKDNSLGKEEEEEKEEPTLKRQKMEDAPNQQSSSALKDALKEAQQEIATKQTTAVVEVSTMAPQKINWDLKRDIKDKLERLERKTQKAIVELLKERLEHEAAEQANSDDSDLD